MPTEANSRYQDAYFTRDGLREDVVPKEWPPEIYFREEILREITNTHHRDSERKMALWTIAALAAFESSGLKFTIPGFQFATFGLADPDIEYEGLAIFAYVTPDSFGSETLPKKGGEIKVGPLPFQVFIRPFIEEKQINLHPGNPALGINKPVGMTCCYARQQSGSPVLLLTAKHVVSNLLPNPPVGREWVPLRDPSDNYSIGRVFNKPPGILDAVLIEPIPSISVKISQFTPPSSVAPGMSVNLMLPSQVGATLPANVLEVNLLPNVTLSKIPANLMAVQIFMDQYGVSGDSGSLIIDAGTSSGVAIYTGKSDLTPYGGKVRGVGQYLGQIADAMNVTLWTE